ncbi:tRNA (guanine(26)-N(2))-dimethyltransferase-like isoform X2 [Dysidea avara]|uniref:tRNA (guanine(26)-N(2))-dimethyltransferase-like isoform X2 n=1 Tax=Dysidea avara TaxID=196820 RepID=UPI00332331AA
MCEQGAEFDTITEGAATILFPKTNQVFYNPVQEFNRDLSIAVIKHYAKCYWKSNSFRKKKGPSEEKRPSDKTEEELIPEVTPAPSEITEDQKPDRPVDGNDQPPDQPVCDDGQDQQEANEAPGEVKSKVSKKWHVTRGGLHILEALAASGLRSIRYALEVPGVEKVVANDYSRAAYQNMVRNIEHNKVGDKVKPSYNDASMLMYEHRSSPEKRFDVIDLDPYGTPSQFLDATLQAVSDGGLLCVTCTDMSVLCGNHADSSHSKYGSMSLKARYCHEMALRIVLACLESHANRYHRYTIPLLSCSVDFYVRVFVRVFTSPALVKRTPSKLSMVYHCNGCESFHLQPLGKKIEEGKRRKYPPSTGPPVDRKCDQCGHVFKLGGPIWSEPMHDVEFVNGLLADVKEESSKYETFERIDGLLNVISEELQDVPLYYVLDHLCGKLHCNSPKMLAIRSAIMSLGYRVSLSHASANSIKTDAPHHVIWDIMRCWVKGNPVKAIKKDTITSALLSIEPKIEANFSVIAGANPKSRSLKLSRFPENPQANWGPKARAVPRKRGDDAEVEDIPAKRQRLQGKRTTNKTE